MATDSYTQKKINDILHDHQASVQQMAGSVTTLANQGRRTVSLWAMAAAMMDPVDATLAGQKFGADATAQWGSSKENLATALDSLALGTGKTRQELLDELAAMPATTFG